MCVCGVCTSGLCVCGSNSVLFVLRQDLVEKVVVLRKAVEQNQESDPSAVGLLLGEKMSQYASLLASQGSLTNAIAYLPQNTEQVNDIHNTFAPQSASGYSFRAGT